MRRISRSVTLVAGVALLALVLSGIPICMSAYAATDTWQILIPNDDTYMDSGSRGGECLAGDLLADEGTLPALKAKALAPGMYQADFRLCVSHTINKYIARVKFSISAQQNEETLARREFSLVAFENPNQYQNFRLSFATKKGGPVTFTVGFAWDGIRGAKRPYPIESIKMGDDGMVDDAAMDDDEFQLDRELTSLPWHVALDQISLSPATKVTVEGFTVDKVRYKPGETLRTVGEVVNYSTRARAVTVIIELIRDMNIVKEVVRSEMSLPAGARRPLKVSANVGQTLWGREARVRILEGEAELSRSSEYFTVHDNPWAVSIGLYGLQLARYRAGDPPEYKRCKDMAQRKRGSSYGNMVEFVFWAEDDFGDLTPTADEYFCGQLRHPGGAEATRQLIDAFHSAGIACSFYARVKVSCGKKGFDLYRKHPDWFRPGFYDVSHLDRWDRSKALISWPRIGVRGDKPEAYRHHAEEIIRSEADFGWDAIRYDSDMSTKEQDGVSYPVAKYFPEIKQIVNKALPKFQWGYNDALHRKNLKKQPELKKLFDTLCEGGGMIMDEYNNHAFKDSWTYERYAGRHRGMRQMVHENGGHFTLCPADLKWINDMIYQGILPLVARAHHAWDPHRGWVPYANYHRFSTRYAGAIWDPKAIVMPGAKDRIDWGPATEKLFHPHDYAYLRPRGENRSDLILHLVNQPPERACRYDDNRVNPPLTAIKGTIKIPAGLKASGVYAATAEPALHQEALKFTQRKGALSFTVPKLRFWTMVVVELEGKGEWE